MIAETEDPGINRKFVALSLFSGPHESYPLTIGDLRWQEAFTEMSTQVLNSGKIKQGLKDILLNRTNLYEALRETDSLGRRVARIQSGCLPDKAAASVPGCRARKPVWKNVDSCGVPERTA